MMKYKILDILKQKKDYVSGEKISEQLGISRNAVWKHINALRSDSFEIVSATNKGYMLVKEPDIINPMLLEEAVEGRVYYFKETQSTNIAAKAARDVPDKSLFIAESQTGGRGRLGRSWSSPTGDGIWMSLYLKPQISPVFVAQLTLVAGLAVSRAIENTSIKWPNDILMGDKKICGILTEMAAETDRVEHVIVGIGINVNNKRFPKELHDKATSLYIENGRKYKREEIIIKIINEFNSLYDLFLIRGFSALRSEYKEKCSTLNRRVAVISNGSEIIADAVDITENGELVVNADGKNIAVNSGEVSVRGLLGYN